MAETQEMEKIIRLEERVDHLRQDIQDLKSEIKDLRESIHSLDLKISQLDKKFTPLLTVIIFLIVIFNPTSLQMILKVLGLLK